MSRDDDRTWAELVETFHASSDASRRDDKRAWPEAEDVPDDDDDSDLYEPTFTEWTTSATPTIADDESGRPEPVDDDAEPAADDEAANHFEPPAPPPIPRGDAIGRAAWAGVLGSPALLILLSLLQWSPPSWMMFAMVCGFVGGFVVLIARLRGHHPDDPDSGAVI